MKMGSFFSILQYMQRLIYPTNSPGISLLILIGFTLICAFVSQVLVLMIYALASGDAAGVLNSSINMGSANGQHSGLFHWLLGASSVGTFLLPVLVLQFIERKSPINYLPFAVHKSGWLFLIAVLFLFAFNPLLSLVSAWNMDMQLPESWSAIQDWMRAKEDEMARLTGNLVMNDSISNLMINLLVIAVLPAIAEELYFRGALQNILGRWIANKHVVIWLTAIIFSAIHVQFFGFLPRMFLGAMFGYMLVYSKTLWIPILAHLVNNASVVIVAFYYHKQGKTYEQLMADNSYHVGLYFLSLVASVALGWYFYKLSSKQNTNKWNQAG